MNRTRLSLGLPISMMSPVVSTVWNLKDTLACCMFSFTSKPCRLESSVFPTTASLCSPEDRSKADAWSPSPPCQNGPNQAELTCIRSQLKSKDMKIESFIETDSKHEIMKSTLISYSYLHFEIQESMTHLF